MQKYVLVSLLENMDEGTEFSATNWPLHVTLASNFAVDWESSNLLEKLSTLVAERKPIVTVGGDDDYFGSQKQIHVTLLEMNEQLAALHNDIIDLLKSAGAVFDEPQYLKEGYKPHATVQNYARLHKDDPVHINVLTIVDMFPHNDISRRRLLKTVKLTGK